MPYWLRFSIFLTVASALAFIGGQLISEVGLMANIVRNYYGVCGPSDWSEGSLQGKALT